MKIVDQKGKMTFVSAKSKDGKAEIAKRTAEKEAAEKAKEGKKK